MDWDTFNKLRVILANEGWDYVYMYLSGEPLLHPHYWEMLLAMSHSGIVTDTASKLCFPIDWSSAAVTLGELYAKTHFDITIDAHTQELQDKVSVGINNAQVFDNLSALAKLRSPKVSVSVITVRNAYNQGHLDAIRKRVEACGISRWTHKPMGYYMGYLLTPEDEAMMAELAPKNSPRFSVQKGHVVSNMTSCSHFLKPVIGVTGDVTVCCHDMLFKEAQWNVLTAGSLDKIVNSPSYRATRSKGGTMSLSICQGCN